MNRYKLHESHKQPLGYLSKWIIKLEYKGKFADYVILRSIVDKESSQNPNTVMWWCDICLANGGGTCIGQVKESELLKRYTYESI